MRAKLFVPIFLVVPLVLITTFDVEAQNTTIPEWVKNNAKWWSDGSISESDYVSSLQYLINQGILNIPIPISEVTAATSPVSDSERAQSLVVHFSEGLIKSHVTINTFSKFQLISKTDNPADPYYHVYKFGEPNEFYLESLPSKDKMPVYDEINRWLIQTSPLEQFNVDVDIIAGDGTIIQRWAFGFCELTGYGTYLQDIWNVYTFHGEEESELRDRWNFRCGDLSLKVP